MWTQLSNYNQPQSFEIRSQSLACSVSTIVDSPFFPLLFLVYRIVAWTNNFQLLMNIIRPHFLLLNNFNIAARFNAEWHSFITFCTHPTSAREEWLHFYWQSFHIMFIRTSNIFSVSSTRSPFCPPRFKQVLQVALLAMLCFRSKSIIKYSRGNII